MELKFVPSDEAVMLAIQSQRGLNSRLYAARPAAAPKAPAAGSAMYNMVLGLVGAVAEAAAPAAAKPGASSVDPEVLERARSAIGAKVIRAVGTLARRKSGKRKLPILRADKFDPALRAALIERLGLVVDSPDSNRFLSLLAREFSMWVDANSGDLAGAGFARSKDGRLVFSAADVPAEASAAAAEAEPARAHLRAA